MTYQFEFRHPSTLSDYWIGRAVNFIRELDHTAATLQPPNSKPVSMGFDKLFHGDADADNGHAILQKMFKDFQKPGFRRTSKAATAYLMCVLALAFHNAVHALQAQTAEASSSYMEDARYMLGYLDCLINRVSDPWDVSWQARKGAATTNSVYNSTKQHVFEWCDANFAGCPSTNAASIKVAHIEGIDPRTAKKYIEEWEAAKKVAKKTDIR